MIALLMSLEQQLDEEQRRKPMFYALKKLAPHLTKDLRKMPEEQLRNGMRMIATGILAACDGEDTTEHVAALAEHAAVLHLPATEQSA